MISPNELGSDASLSTALFPGEVVTKALVRDVELPYGAGTMALACTRTTCSRGTANMPNG